MLYTSKGPGDRGHAPRAADHLRHMLLNNIAGVGEVLPTESSILIQALYPRRIRRLINKFIFCGEIMGLRARDRSHWIRLEVLCYFVVLWPELWYGPGTDMNRCCTTPSNNKNQRVLEVCWGRVAVKPCNCKIFNKPILWNNCANHVKWMWKKVESISTNVSHNIYTYGSHFGGQGPPPLGPKAQRLLPPHTHTNTKNVTNIYIYLYIYIWNAVEYMSLIDVVLFSHLFTKNEKPWTLQHRIVEETISNWSKLILNFKTEYLLGFWSQLSISWGALSAHFWKTGTSTNLGGNVS